ncbi:AraC family transcriptional regulator [Alteromonas lipolytica]|nr:AraC family transcriptional regulator [Alteromonas lipolytica]GGF72540.1 transcriptional regulator [Alteromonas lipolytica]
MREDKTKYGSASNHYLTALCEVAKANHLNLKRLLRRCNIDYGVINKPGLRVKTEKLSKLQSLVWRLLGDESARLCGIPMKTGTYNMMGLLTVHQPTLKQAIIRGIAFYNLVVADDFVELSLEGDKAELIFRLPSPESDHKFLFAEMVLLAWHRYCSWLIASSIPLSVVKFNYPPPPHVHEYHYLFPGEHEFNCQRLSIAFPAHYLSKPVKQNEGALSSFMQRCPLELFRQYKSDYSLTSEIRHLLISDIESGLLTIDLVASSLHMTSRTLMRRLKEEGTCFQQIKDVVRRDRAVMLLTQQNTPISVIAESVGFADPAAFTRAFRGWTGVTPKKFRDLHTAEIN